MVTNLAEIHGGMEVFAVDGELIGEVLEVERPQGQGDDLGAGPDVPAGGSLAPATEMSGGQQGTAPGSGGADALRGYGDTTDQGGVPLTTGATAGSLENLRGGGDDLKPRPRVASHARSGHIMVEDRGVMGVGAGGLRVPFDAVLDVMPGRRVTLDCTREEARNRYGPGPSLDIDENAPVTPY